MEHKYKVQQAACQQLSASDVGPSIERSDSIIGEQVKVRPIDLYEALCKRTPCSDCSESWVSKKK